MAVGDSPHIAGILYFKKTQNKPQRSPVNQKISGLC